MSNPNFGFASILNRHFSTLSVHFSQVEIPEKELFSFPFFGNSGIPTGFQVHFRSPPCSFRLLRDLLRHPQLQIWETHWNLVSILRWVGFVDIWPDLKHTVSLHFNAYKGIKLLHELTVHVATSWPNLSLLSFAELCAHSGNKPWMDQAGLNRWRAARFWYPRGKESAHWPFTRRLLT